jgi:hypothetical protein
LCLKPFRKINTIEKTGLIYTRNGKVDDALEVIKQKINLHFTALPDTKKNANFVVLKMLA